jgi:hypothetical protein
LHSTVAARVKTTLQDLLRDLQSVFHVWQLRTNRSSRRRSWLEKGDMEYRVN